MHARIAGRSVRLLTRTGLDSTERFPHAAKAFRSLGVRSAYVDGELCGISEAGSTSFSSTQIAQDHADGERLVYIAFDLLHVDSEDLRSSAFLKRKERLAAMLCNHPGAESIRYGEHRLVAVPIFSDGPASLISKAWSQSASMRPTRRAVASFGSSRNASTGKSLWWSAGLIPKDRGNTSGHSCWATTNRMAGSSTLAG